MELDPTTLTLQQLASAYRNHTLKPSEVTEAFLARIHPDTAWRTILTDRARRQAAAADRAFAAATPVGPLHGIPIALKDLLDVEGEVSVAGSAALLARGQIAERDAPVVARLDAAGAVFLGKTHMTELAFSGLGLNPHFGTPGSAHDPSRIPGGSSSGSAVVVARGEATAAIGSDTGGSVRIPAALQGLCGLKVTDGAIPTEGAVALSTTLDTIGPIAKTLEDVWVLWRAMRAVSPAPMPKAERALRLAAPPTVFMDRLDPEVKAAFETGLDRLERAGHEIDRTERPILEQVQSLYARYGSFAAYEALALHDDLLREADPPVDPRVEMRIRAVENRPASDYLRLGYERDALRNAFWMDMAGFDAILAPTVAIRAPRITDLDNDEEAYVAANGMILRNTTMFNLLGGPAVTVPILPRPMGVGGMIATAPGTEHHAIAVARAWQDVLSDLVEA